MSSSYNMAQATALRQNIRSLRTSPSAIARHLDRCRKEWQYSSCCQFRSARFHMDVLLFSDIKKPERLLSHMYYAARIAKRPHRPASDTRERAALCCQVPPQSESVFLPSGRLHLQPPLVFLTRRRL